jgi:hypothetical protein
VRGLEVARPALGLVQQAVDGRVAAVLDQRGQVPGDGVDVVQSGGGHALMMATQVSVPPPPVVPVMEPSCWKPALPSAID